MPPRISHRQLPGKQNRTFHLVSLGCPKNRVDSERILAVLFGAGFVFEEDPVKAQVIIVNTCAFIQDAVEESINTILDHRADNASAFLVVAGCLTLRYGEDVREELTEVDLFITPAAIEKLPELMAGEQVLEPPATRSGAVRAERAITTPGFAYLKISEGCSRGCQYCTIPSIRGPFRSSPADALEREARQLAAGGIRELVLVAQDLTSYGIDRGEKSGLIRLLERLSVVPGIEWIRLMYLHPNGIPRGLAKTIATTDTLLPYLDIPFQHVSSRVLKAMGRPWKGGRIRTLVESLRAAIPGLVLRTTLMVGFPGEGDREFQELRDFVEEYGIERVGVFEYSPEEGTGAAALGDPVPSEVKAARAAEIRGLAATLLAKRNRTRKGARERALIEGLSSESDLLLQGRTWDQAPEVDGVLYITSGEAQAGELHPVRITGSYGPDLFGEIPETDSTDA